MSEPRYDVFLSYNSNDGPAVGAIAHALRHAGLEPWLDQWHLTPGGDWQVELAAGVRDSRACAVFIGPHSIGSWSALEVRLALDRVAKDPSFRCFPVLLPGVPEPFNADALPPFLGAFTWVNLRAGIDDPAALQMLINAIRGLPFGVPPLPEAAKRSQQPDQAPVAALPPTNLPAELTSLLGREREQAELSTLLSTDLATGGSRLVTLVGPGGAGKTRLSLAVAQALRSQFPEGVWLVELAALTDAAQVPAQIAGVLHVQEEPGRPIGRTLVAYLKPRALLLVLDNCEHLIDACAQLATATLAAAPGVRILASSREPLGTVGEQAYRVRSLPVPDPGVALTSDTLGTYAAVQLFVERARARKHDFALTPQNAGAVAQICARLDGLPLALELAAARITALPPEAIAARLDDRFKLLTGGPRTVLPRQQTLRAALDWSYGLLTAPECALLRRLSIFGSGCALEAAEEVCAGDDMESWEVLDLLSSLVNKSLVQAEEGGDEPRYRLLESVRQYGAERREQAGESAAVQDRLLAWCRALAGQAEPALRGPGQARWLTRLETEFATLRVALAWSMGDAQRADTGLALAGLLDTFWSVRGHFSEGRRWLEQLLATAQEPGGAVLARAAAAAGKLAHNMGDYPAARAHFDAALTAQHAAGDDAGAADTLRRLGSVANRQNRVDEAVDLYTQSLALATKLGDRWSMAAAHNNLAGLASRRGDFAEAARQFAGALASFRALDDQGSVANVLNNMGLLACEQGQSEQAVAYFTEALSIRRLLDDKLGTAHAMTNLGLVAFRTGTHNSALDMFEESLALSRTIGARSDTAMSCHNLAEVHLALGQPIQAARYIRESLDLREALGDQVGLADALEVAAAVIDRAGMHQDAATLLGAVAAQRVALHADRTPRARAVQERLPHDVQTAMGAEEFRAAWQAGSVLDAHAATMWAREHLRPV